MPDQPTCFDDILAGAKRLAGIANPTPVMTSRQFNRRVRAQVFFKCENFQRAGAFKFRGAYNAVSQLTDEQKSSGVLTFSSGNHAQAIALAGSLLGVSTTIVMPENAPEVKRQATREYGGKIVLYDPTKSQREELARNLGEEHGLTLIPPYDHPHVIAGQGTAAKELFEQIGELDYLVVPCGGGGLLSGCALAARAMSPKCKVIGIEPEAGDDATRSYRTGELQFVQNPETIADGARTPSLGKFTFPIILSNVDDMQTVNDAAIIRAMRLLCERMKIVVEPTGALAPAALLEGTIPVEGLRVGAIISGGNMDISYAAELMGMEQLS